MKKWIFLSLGILAASFFFFTKHTVTIFPYSIPSAQPFHSEWEVSSLEHDIFSQPYTYLGKGDQCIAFESQDRQYVLKFPYHTHRVPLFSLTDRAEQKLNRSIHKKLQKDAQSLTLAFTQCKEETGLLAIHCNRTSTLNRTLTVIDEDKKTHNIDLDAVVFCVQKKAKLLSTALEEWMHSGQSDLAKQGLANLVKFLYERSKKGLEDPETHLEGNIGYLGTDPMLIDFGHLKKREGSCDSKAEQEKIRRLLLPLKEQLDASYPELADYLENRLTLTWQ